MTNWEKTTYKVNNTERGAYCAISNSIAIKKEPKHRAGLHNSFPFLRQLNSDKTPADSALVNWFLLINLWLPSGSVVKNPPASAGDTGSIPESGRSLEKEMAIHSNILAWGSLVVSSPWGHKRVGHDLETKHQQLRADFTRMNRMPVVYFKWFLFLFSCGKLEGIFL